MKFTDVLSGRFLVIALVFLMGTDGMNAPAHAGHGPEQQPEKPEIHSVSPLSGEIYLVDLRASQLIRLSQSLGEKILGVRDVEWFDNAKRVGVVSLHGVYAVDTDLWEETRLSEKEVQSFCFSLATDAFFSVSDERFIVTDASGKRLYSTFFQGDLLSCSPDGRAAVLVTDRGSAYLFNMEKKAFEKIADLTVDTLHVEWTTNTLLLYDYSNLWVINRETGRLAYFNDLMNASFSPDRRAVVFRKGDGQSVRLLDLETGVEKKLLTEGGYIHSAWSRDGKWIAMVTIDGKIRLSDRDGAIQKVLVDISYDWQWGGMVLPYWSGREDKLYYVQRDGVWEVDINGQRSKSEIVSFPFWVAPTWNHAVEYGQGKVSVVELASGKRTVLLETQEVGRWWSQWSPDGTKLLLYDFPPLPQWQ